MRCAFFILSVLLMMTTHAEVLELRQYKIFPDKRDAMINVFDSKLIEGQEAVGIRVLGQFRDLDDPDRFTWMRQFANMDARAKALSDFYTSPTWKAHRGEANPLLEDNDNVLLLRPATGELSLPPSSGVRNAVGAPPGSSGLFVVTIYYLWKDPSEGFTNFFTTQLAPELKNAGFNVLGAYVAETTPNNFPALPVRQYEKVFVWFARVADADAATKARDSFDKRVGENALLARALAGYQERQSQFLRLSPTSRSLLR